MARMAILDAAFGFASLIPSATSSGISWYGTVGHSLMDSFIEFVVGGDVVRSEGENL